MVYLEDDFVGEDEEGLVDPENMSRNKMRFKYDDDD